MRMSFEGYYQILCSKGHYWEVDCHSFLDHEIGSMKCPHCGSEPAWWNLVDVTNGSYDEEGRRIDGYVPLKLKERRVCHVCGSVLEEVYEIPSEEYVEKFKRPYFEEGVR